MFKKFFLYVLFTFTSMASESEQILLTTVDDQNITLTSTEKGIDFGIYKGKIIILDFLHTQCPPCIRGLEHMGAIQAKYPDNVKVITLVMDKKRSNQEIKEFMEFYDANTTFTNSPANRELGKVLGGIDIFPTVILFDQHGEYLNDYKGIVTVESLESDIEMALDD